MISTRDLIFITVGASSRQAKSAHTWPWQSLSDILLSRQSFSNRDFHSVPESLFDVINAIENLFK